MVYLHHSILVVKNVFQLIRIKNLSQQKIYKSSSSNLKFVEREIVMVTQNILSALSNIQVKYLQEYSVSENKTNYLKEILEKVCTSDIAKKIKKLLDYLILRFHVY